MTTALEVGEGSESRPGRPLPPGKTRSPLYRRLGEPQGRSGQVRKISPPPGFDLRTIQPAAQSLYQLRYLAHFLHAGSARIQLQPRVFHRRQQFEDSRLRKPKQKTLTNGVLPDDIKNKSGNKNFHQRTIRVIW
jgi:hypothetical protein